MSQYTVELTRFAEEDFAALDHSLRILALKQLCKLERYPLAGEPLGHKFGYGLSGYRSLHLFEVYRRAAERKG